MLDKADSNKDDRISFDDFYSVMVKNIYWWSDWINFELIIFGLDL